MKRRDKESGFAMLLVFLMAACIAITLYFEVPRVAFQAERQRELLLVDRGNQFKRAIQVFVTDQTNNPTHRYPASLDELESFNNHRYLRHRYLDPMTGKDEWRLVHINGGVLTDSVTTQARPGGAGQSGSNTPAGPEFISQQAFLDTGAGGPAAGGVTRALNRRPSESQQPGAPGGPGESGVSPDGSQGTPGTVAGANGTGVPGLPGQPGTNNPALPPGLPGMPPGIPGQQGAPGSAQNGQQQQQASASCFIGSCTPTTTNSGQPGGQPMGQPNAGGFPGGIPGIGQQGSQSNAQSAAASMIGNLLTTPRPGGMPSGMPGSTIGGGIAGVASKYEAEGIMVINQRTKINEWEYIFDQTKYRVPPNPVSGPVGTPQQQMGPGGTTTGPGGTMTTGGPGGGGPAPAPPPPNGPGGIGQ